MILLKDVFLLLYQRNSDNFVQDFTIFVLHKLVSFHFVQENEGVVILRVTIADSNKIKT